MKRITIAFILLTALLAWRCTTPVETIEEHYLRVNYSALTFFTSGNASVTIAVDAFPQKWEAESLDAWLEIVEKTENSITIAAKDYDGIDNREGSITISTEDSQHTIKVHQLGKGVSLPMKYRIIEESFSAAISPNGKYVGGFYTLSDAQDNRSYCPFIIDVQTDNRTVLGPYPKAVYHLMDAMAMNDQGILYIDEGNNGGVACFTVDGDAYMSKAAPGFDRPTVISGTSLDGRVMIGWGAGSPEGHTYGPVKIEDGVYYALPLPEKNFRNEKFSAGVLGRGVSANGEILYGATWENDDSGMVYWDKEGKVHYVGMDVRVEREVEMIDGLGEPYNYTLVNGIIATGGAGCASPSGEWLAGVFRTEDVNDKKSDFIFSYCPAFFNTKTQKTTLFEDYKGYGACVVTDDGLGFTSPVGGVGGSGPIFDIVNQTVVYNNFPEYIKDKFGITLPAGTQLDYLCPDGKTFLGNIIRVTELGPDVFYCYGAQTLDSAE